MSIHEFILVELDKGVEKIKLNRPKQLNALTYPLIVEIIEVLEQSMKNKSIRVITIEGAGNNFCSGDDLKSMGSEGLRFKPLEDGSRLPHQKMVRLIREIQKPVVALLRGYCLGAGFELALACDFRLAADDLIIGDHRTTRAICILSGASWLLPRIVGFGRAMEIIMTGRHLDAKEAFKIGLVTKVFPSLDFEKEADKFVQELATMPTRCLGYNKAMLNYSLVNAFFPSLQNEFDLYCKNMATRDFGEGLKSFLEKRKPRFIGR